MGCLHLTDVRFQYAEEKYTLDMTSASNLHQLNLALTRGAEKETFVFPKGPSGKVKLAPKRPRVPADAKEVCDLTLLESYCSIRYRTPSRLPKRLRLRK